MVSTHPSQATRDSGVLPSLWAGLILTAGVLAAFVVDQVSLHSIADDVERHYAPFGAVPDPALIFTIAYVTGGLCLVGWAVMIRAVAADRAWAPWASVAALVIGVCGGLYVLVVTEYGEPVLPLPWSALPLVPCLAGSVAVAAMWKGRRGGRA